MGAVRRSLIVCIAGLVTVSACEGQAGPASPPAGPVDEAAPSAEEEPTVDRSSESYVENLLAKETAGEWTRAEGLVATLRLLAGEADAAEVLRHGTVTEAEGTGIVMMARSFLAGSPDQQARAEITRLLDRLVFSNERLEAMAGIGDLGAFGPGTLAAGLAADPEEDCRLFFADLEPEGVGPCLRMRSLTGVTTPYPGPYRVFGPVPEAPSGGWTDEHYDLVLEALREAVERYSQLRGGPTLDIPPVNVVLSVAPAGFASADPVENQPCGVVLYTTLQSFAPVNFKHVIAHEVAHCLQTETFPAQNKVDYQFIRWREEGMSEYLASLVYPTNNLEWAEERMKKLEQAELATTLLDRSYANFMFFMDLDARDGEEAVFDLIRHLPTVSGTQPQIDALLTYPGLVEKYHQFVRLTTDEKLPDTGGGFGPYPMTETNQPPVVITTTGPAVAAPLRPFGLIRRRLTVEPGKQACLTYEEGARVESRPSSGGEWTGLPVLLPMKAGEPDDVVMVATSQQPVAFQLVVVSLHELTESEVGGDPVGDWVVDNASLRRKVEFVAPVQTLTSISGRIRVSFRDDGTVRLAYEGFEVSGFSDVKLERGAFSADYQSTYSSVTAAEGEEAYRVAGDYIFYDSLTEGEFLEGTETVSRTNQGLFLGIDAGEAELDVELPESTVDTRPASGWAILGAANQFRFACGGQVLVLDDEIVLRRSSN